jgi:aryl-alcohol dehydrogenase-like predicted oxidoreductase
VRCTAGMLTGKYSKDRLPKGPRGVLFRQILPGIEPLTETIQQVAASRRKSPSQVSTVHPMGSTFVSRYVHDV